MELLDERSKFDLFESQELRNRAANAPLGADSGPGEIAIMLPVLARCMVISVSGGNGAVCGVRDPDVSSLSGLGQENLLFMADEEENPTLLPKPWFCVRLFWFCLRRPLRNS